MVYTCMYCEFDGKHQDCINPTFCDCAKNNHFEELKTKRSKNNE